MNKKVMDAINQSAKRNEEKNKKVVDLAIKNVQKRLHESTIEKDLESPVKFEDLVNVIEESPITIDEIEDLIRYYNPKNLKAQKAIPLKVEPKDEASNDSENETLVQILHEPVTLYKPIGEIVNCVIQVLEERKYLDVAFYKLEKRDESKISDHISTELFSYHYIRDIVMMELHYELKIFEKYRKNDYTSLNSEIYKFYSELLNKQKQKYDEDVFVETVEAFVKRTMEVFPKGKVFPDPNPKMGQGIARVFFDDYSDVLQYIIEDLYENNEDKSVIKKAYGDQLERYTSFRNGIYEAIRYSDKGNNYSSYFIEKYWKFGVFSELLSFLKKSSIPFIKSEVAFLDYIYDIPLKNLREKLFAEHFKLTRLKGQHASLRVRAAYQFRAKTILYYRVLPKIIIDFLLDLLWNINYPIERVDLEFLEKTDFYKAHDFELEIEKDWVTGAKRLLSVMTLCNSEAHQEAYDISLEISSEDLGADLLGLRKDMDNELDNETKRYENPEKLSKLIVSDSGSYIDLGVIDKAYQEIWSEYDQMYKENLIKCFEKQAKRSK